MAIFTELDVDRSANAESRMRGAHRSPACSLYRSASSFRRNTAATAPDRAVKRNLQLEEMPELPRSRPESKA
jgi:hypothetical protein